MGIKFLLISYLTLQAAAPSTGPQFINLYSDNRAYRVNDIVTVVVTETSSASEQATTVTAKKNNLSAKVSALWNNSFAGKLFGKGTDGAVDYPSMDITSDMSFDGSGTTSRKGSFTARVAAVVQEVQPNGNLIIEGKRTIVVNQEKRHLTVSGIVRPEDIASDNTVSSGMVADAQISYEGDGPITNKARQGWVMKFFDWIPIF